MAIQSEPYSCFSPPPPKKKRFLWGCPGGPNGSAELTVVLVLRFWSESPPTPSLGHQCVCWCDGGRGGLSDIRLQLLFYHLPPTSRTHTHTHTPSLPHFFVLTARLPLTMNGSLRPRAFGLQLSLEDFEFR